MPDLPVARLLAYGLPALLIAGIGVWSLQGSRGRSSGAAPGAAVATRPSTGSGDPAEGVAVRVPAPAAPAVVHVAGAVRRPGVYRLTDGSRVKDAVHRAGGATRRADLNAINLAAKVADGQQVVVPQRQAAPSPAGGAATADAEPGGGAAPGPATPVGLNAATLEQLQTLDGVGPATAQKIVAWRTEHGGFRSVDDLGQVPGIGPKRLAALREHVQP